MTGMVKNHVTTVQLDIMDGRYVPEKTWPFVYGTDRDLRDLRRPRCRLRATPRTSRACGRGGVASAQPPAREASAGCNVHARREDANVLGLDGRRLWRPLGDRFWIDGLPQQARMFGFPPAEAFTPTRWLQDGDTVIIGHSELTVEPGLSGFESLLAVDEFSGLDADHIAGLFQRGSCGPSGTSFPAGFTYGSARLTLAISVRIRVSSPCPRPPGRGCSSSCAGSGGASTRRVS